MGLDNPIRKELEEEIKKNEDEIISKEMSWKCMTKINFQVRVSQFLNDTYKELEQFLKDETLFLGLKYTLV